METSLFELPNNLYILVDTINGIDNIKVEAVFAAEEFAKEYRARNIDVSLQDKYPILTYDARFYIDTNWPEIERCIKRDILQNKVL